MAGDRLRYWLERALQLRTSSYGTASDAYADLREVPSESPASAIDQLTGEFETPLKRSLQPARPAAGQVAAMHNAPAPQDLPVPSAPLQAQPALVPPETRRADTTPVAPPPAPKPPAARPARPPAARVAVSSPPALAAKKFATILATFKAPRVSPWIAAGLATIALAEGGVIAALLMRQPALTENTAAAAPPSPIPPAETPAPAEPTTLAAGIAPVTAAPPPPQPEVADPIAAAANNQRSGGIRFRSPIELKVLQGERVLGSTADGPIVASAGTHQLDLVNSALGFSVRRAVTFRAGQIANLDIAIPQGRVSVNAQPWAEVLIDSKPVGETPLANLSVPLGEHEVLFRHPELGERRQRITVRADAPTRVSTSFDR
jgi:hypothetical protein